MDAQELIRLKEQLNDARLLRERAQGKLDAAKEALAALGFKTMKSANKERDALKELVQQLEESLESKIRRFEKRWIE